MLCCFNITCTWSIMSDNFYIYSDFSMRCIRQTTRGCSSYRSSRAGWRFGRSGSSGFVVGFRRLRWCGLDRRNRFRAYHNALRQYSTSGLEVSCGLRLVKIYITNYLKLHHLHLIPFLNFPIWYCLCKKGWDCPIFRKYGFFHQPKIP